jgi:hypothetical protein
LSQKFLPANGQLALSTTIILKTSFLHGEYYFGYKIFFFSMYTIPVLQGKFRVKSGYGIFRVADGDHTEQNPSTYGKF